jgi:hypothetical protein
MASPELTECEKRLWHDAAPSGKSLDLLTEESDDPTNGAQWGTERTVRADVLYRLLVDEATPRAVVLRAVRISGGLNLEATTLRCPLIFEGCFFDGPINLRQARAEAIRITGCQLGVVAAAGLETRGDLDLDRSTVAVISLVGAHLGGELSLNGTSLTGGKWPLELAETTLVPFDEVTTDSERREEVALVADRLEVEGGMFCGEGFVAQGEVRLAGAHIAGQLSFDGAKLTNKDARALTADFLKVEGGMFCEEGFVAQGEVSLLGAHIAGQLSFTGAKLTNKDAPALNADRLKVEGGMFCGEGFDAQGEVRLAGAHIAGQLGLNGASLLDSTLNLREATVPASLWLRFVAAPKGADLRGARVGTLYDSKETWPIKLYLGGLTYDRLEADPAVSSKDRLRWIKLDPAGYAPQPYEQLIASYRRAGHEEDARRVAIAKQQSRRGTLSWPGKIWSLLLGATAGHGYRAWFAGLWLVLLWLVGGVLFGLAYPEHFKAAGPTAEIPAFQPLLYSVDLVLPIVDLGQHDAWIAEGPAQLGVFLTLAGWVLATAAVAALTGLLKKD